VFTSKKDITKLLLKGCDCENCKFLSSDSTKRWCKNQRKKPKSNICTTWEKNLFDLSALFDIVRVGYPSIVASDIIGEYPMKKATSEALLTSKILSGEIEIGDIFNGKRIDKKSFKK